MSEYILKNARIIDPGRNVDSIGDIGVSGKVIEAPEKLTLAAGRRWLRAAGS